eukprot:6186611-Pleurochrysis_carterae.AAC.2
MSVCVLRGACPSSLAATCVHVRASQDSENFVKTSVHESLDLSELATVIIGLAVQATRPSLFVED